MQIINAFVINLYFQISKSFLSFYILGVVSTLNLHALQSQTLNILYSTVDELSALSEPFLTPEFHALVERIRHLPNTM